MIVLLDGRKQSANAALRRQEKVLVEPVLSGLVVRMKLEWQVEAASAHELEQRFDARRDHGLLPTGDDRPIAACPVRKLGLRESRSEPGFTDKGSAAHGASLLRDLKEHYYAYMLREVE
jgi:hypothetical protein